MRASKKSKIIQRRFLCSSIVLIAIQNGFSCAQTTQQSDLKATITSTTDISNRPKTKFTPPAPFSPQDFLGDFISLYQKSDGVITSDKFSDHFGITMQTGMYNQELKVNFLNFEDWYFHVVISDFNIKQKTNGSELLVAVDIPVNAFDGWEHGNCLKLQDASKQLIDAGWKVIRSDLIGLSDATFGWDVLDNGKSQWVLRYPRLRKGDDGLMTVVDNISRCVTTFSISTNR